MKSISYLNTKEKNKKKLSIPSKTIFAKENEYGLKKPNWLKIKLPLNNKKINKIKLIMRKNNLHTVCEEAACPNLAECFNRGTATFMILGSICTRRCPFCNVSSGRPSLVDTKEPENLSKAAIKMKLKHIVITSVDRDDLKDGGSEHFSNCIRFIRKKNPDIKIEILVPDFRGCTELALNNISTYPPDIFNHNLESIPRLYSKVRPGANYKRSLELLEKFNLINPNIPTKSGLMLGLGETKEEIIEVMKDLRKSYVSMITIGQYLRPTKNHLTVNRYVHPKEFRELNLIAFDLGFKHAMCGPLVRSSYHAENQINCY
ncbi:lipA [Wigglesworthia glossinidia endosymbiont of Glossina brevipalpis]|uniref:Lipoyl synthase n=1 Tax=Wigglesworthia glossinidia brevipalpis TaxID=36870 RepID=LIPA_WIGBR|nr:RecName: Full=Lipoyl synthase; AltName: Full=Lip-syn; Short=LS; AltName: Full=Lipoate synthase; AltName: Full=Lipoic acid synthase; AltName: Full=Sulfur insertion protein LipA [Wigglesworthia glossinidia endosymbiont of Glossina brevipalpis]BAC24322.1 lipA [Wigglesworthia glossinidia endosymbiont of Glossina brevipalpis]